MQCTSDGSGTAYMSVNGLDQGFETDGNWNTMELSPAGMTFTGDMRRQQVFYGLYGYGATHTVTFEDVSVTGCLFVVPVAIDIKPGSDPNSINCKNDRGVITVAVLSTDDFDATTVDHTTVTFEGASEIHVNKNTEEPRRHEEDVDDDGDMDLVFHFRLGDTELDCSSTEGTLEGETFDGQPIEGSDAVRMVGG